MGIQSDGVEVTRILLPHCFKARQVLEREFNNLLALGTERSLTEVDCLSLSDQLLCRHLLF
jgi:hypothetical protein